MAFKNIFFFFWGAEGEGGGVIVDLYDWGSERYKPV